MHAWYVVTAGTGRVDLVDRWESLDAAVAEMASSSWEEPGNATASYVTDESTGEVVAMGLFGPDMELLVMVSDGRQMCFPVPPRYRAAELEDESLIREGKEPAT